MLRDGSGFTVLHWAITQGTDPFCSSSSHDRIEHEQAANNLATIKALVKARPELVKAQCQEKRLTPLQWLEELLALPRRLVG